RRSTSLRVAWNSGRCRRWRRGGPRDWQPAWSRRHRRRRRGGRGGGGRCRGGRGRRLRRLLILLHALVGSLLEPGVVGPARVGGLAGAVVGLGERLPLLVLQVRQTRPLVLDEVQERGQVPLLGLPHRVNEVGDAGKPGPLVALAHDLESAPGGGL